MGGLTFGQVEAVLASMHYIADHKRVAFVGRLKMLQKNGLPIGERPGRGKAATFRFSQLVQLAIGVEFLQAGLPPQRAARIVEQNWPAICHSIVHAFETSLYPDLLEGTMPTEQNQETPIFDLCWVCRLEEFSDLTPEGSSELDDWLLVEPVRLTELSKLLGRFQFAAGGIVQPRMLVIHANGLLVGLLSAMLSFRFATLRGMVEDLRANSKELLPDMPDGCAPWSSNAQRVLQTSRGEGFLLERAREILERAPTRVLKLASQISDVDMIDLYRDDFPLVLQIARWGLIEINEHNDGVLTPLGKVTVRELGKVQEDGNVDQKA